VLFATASVASARIVCQLQSLEAHTDAAAHNGKLGQQHDRSLLLRLRSACLAVSRPNDNPKGAPSMKPHKLSINSHRTRNLLPAVLIGDVRNSPFRQHRWLLQGLLRQQAPTRLDSCCRERTWLASERDDPSGKSYWSGSPRNSPCELSWRRGVFTPPGVFQASSFGLHRGRRSCPHLLMQAASSSEPPTSVGLACRPVGACRRHLMKHF
jgi:hypothetical protein